MKKIIMVTLLLAVMALAACTTQTLPEDISSFEGCVQAGYPVMESYPRQCQVGDEVFIEQVSDDITMNEGQLAAAQAAMQSVRLDGWTVAEVLMADTCESCYTVVLERDGLQNSVSVVDGEVVSATGGQWACTREYMPVCGKVQVQCITAPCPPIDTTFGNLCEAQAAGAFDIRDGECVDEEVNLQGACLSFDGNWLEEFNECEGMPQQMCADLGGNFNECASACRNDPNAEFCTMQCVQVCSFD